MSRPAFHVLKNLPHVAAQQHGGHKRQHAFGVLLDRPNSQTQQSIFGIKQAVYQNEGSKSVSAHAADPWQGRQRLGPLKIQHKDELLV